MYKINSHSQKYTDRIAYCNTIILIIKTIKIVSEHIKVHHSYFPDSIHA